LHPLVIFGKVSDLLGCDAKSNGNSQRRFGEGCLFRVIEGLIAPKEGSSIFFRKFGNCCQSYTIKYESSSAPLRTQNLPGFGKITYMDVYDYWIITNVSYCIHVVVRKK
jgi:hypothetical protein